MSLIQTTKRPEASTKEASSQPGVVECLRCQQPLDSYAFARFTFLPYGSHNGKVMLVCPKCGHVEFMSDSSPLLCYLAADPAAVGDGD
jgi:hypothetical protein